MFDQRRSNNRECAFNFGFHGHGGYYGGRQGRLVSITEMNQGNHEHLIATFKELAEKFNNWNGGYYTFSDDEKINNTTAYFFPGHTCAGWFYVDEEGNFRGQTLMATYSRAWVEKKIKQFQADGRIPGGRLKLQFIATVIAYMQNELDAGW